MARVKRAVNAQKKRRTVLKASKGYRGQRSRLYRKAKEQQLHSLTYAYRDRRARKGEFRKLWISRINAAARANDITYNRLIQGLKAAGVEVDRKNLAEIAVSDPAAFTALVEVAKGALPSDVNRTIGRSCLTLTERSARVAAAIKLHRHVGRRRAARFLAEGPNLVEAALRRGLVSEVFATEAAQARFGSLLTDAQVHLVTERAAKALSETVTPVGLVAVCSVPETSLERRARRFATAAGRRGGDLRAGKRRNPDSCCRCDGRRRRRACRPQCRSVQRQVPARLGGKYLLDPGGVRGGRRRGGVGDQVRPVSRFWPPRSTAKYRSMMRNSAFRRHGCSGRRPTAWRPIWPRWPPIGCEFRCRATPKASTWHRRRRSACIKAPGRTGCNGIAKNAPECRHGVTSDVASWLS